MIDLLKYAASTLMGDSIKPLCSNHEPKVSLQREQGGCVVHIHCDRCNLSMWMSPNTYYDMMVDNMLDEVEESIRGES
jgi:hypothetical protein